MEIEMEDQPKNRILAIEPDPARAATLKRLLRGHVSADFEIVKSCAEAMEAIARCVPDLVLTSTFLQPAEEAALTDSLKQLSEAAHVQLITVPHFIEFEESRVPRARGAELPEFPAAPVSTHPTGLRSTGPSGIRSNTISRKPESRRSRRHNDRCGMRFARKVPR